MKKLILSLLVAAMLPFSAVNAAINEAAQQGAAVVVKGNIGNEKKGVFVTLVVTKQGVATEEISNAFDTNVQYVDQTESDENGNYYFRIYLPEDTDAHTIYIKSGEGKYGIAEKENIRYTAISLVCTALDNVNKAYYETSDAESRKAAMIEALSSEYLALADFREFSDYAALENKDAVAEYMLAAVEKEKLKFATDDEINASVKKVTEDWKKAVGISTVLASANQAEMKAVLNRYSELYGMDVSRLNGIDSEDEHFCAEMKRQNPHTVEALLEAYNISCAFSAVNSVASWGALKEIVLADSENLGINLGNSSDYSKIKDKNAFYKKLVDYVPFDSVENFKEIFDSVVRKSNMQTGGTGSSSGNVSSGNQHGNNVVPVGPVILDKNEKPEEKTTFEDLDSVEWARKSIEYLFEKGIVTGVDSKHFEPQRNITRAEFVKMAVSAFEIQASESSGAFADVNPGAWYYDCVMAGKGAGIISGDENGNFNPGRAISRQDMSVILYRCMKNSEYAFADDSQSFNDADSISSYALEAVEKLSGEGIINGYNDDTFRPFAAATRAEVAQMIYNGIMKRR